MNRNTYDQMRRATAYRRDALLRAKGADYASDDDVLANFKQAAVDAGLGPEKVWLIYAQKQWSAIQAYIRTGKTESEPIISRLDDLRNYLDLFEAMYHVKTGTPINSMTPLLEAAATHIRKPVINNDWRGGLPKASTSPKA